MPSAIRSFRLPWYKRLLLSSVIQSMLCVLMALLLRLMRLTFRVEKHIPEATKPYMQGAQHGIFCFWHGRMILLPFFHPPRKAMRVLISQHRDGELIARLIAQFGIESIRGSSSKGARRAAMLMLDALQAGDNVAVTPDGPRGPAYRAQRGALHLARLSQRPIIPVVFSASRTRQLKSWDQFMIPLPFSRVVLRAGEPFWVDEHASVQALYDRRNELEATMNAMMQQADEVRAR